MHISGVSPGFFWVNHGEPSLSAKSRPRASQDRDYSGCPCRSWNGIVEYRCEAWGRSLLQETTKKGWFSLGLRIESLKESYLKDIDQQVGNTYFIWFSFGLPSHFFGCFVTLLFFRLRRKVESVYRDQHLRRLVAVMHQDTDFAEPWQQQFWWMGFFRPEDCEELQQLRIGSFLSNESPFPTTKKASSKLLDGITVGIWRNTSLDQYLDVFC